MWGGRGRGCSSLSGYLGAVPAPAPQLLAATQARVRPSFGVWVGAGSGLGWREGCPAGSACAQPPLALSFSRRARRAGQRPGRAAAAGLSRRGGRGHPGRPPPPRPRGGGRAPAFVCAAAAGQVRRKRAPSCGRSWAQRPPAPPSLGQIQAWPVSPQRRLLSLPRYVPLGRLCVMRTLHIATSNKGS